MTVTQVTQADGKPLRGEVKSAPLASVQMGGTYVYFTCNGAEGEWPAYMAGGGVYCYRVGDAEAASLYEPEAGRRNWCLASVVASPDGSLFYTNDSGYLFKLKPYAEPDPAPDPTPDPAPAPTPNPGNRDNRTVSLAGASSSATADGESAQAGEEAAPDEVESLALTDEDASAVSVASSARSLQGADAEADADAGDGSGSAHALNPLAVAGIAVGVLALMGVLLWLLLARRKRDGEDKGAGA